MSYVTIWEHQLFDGLTQSQRLWLSERVEHKAFPAKSIIFQPDEPSQQLFYLLNGHVKIEVMPGGKNWLIREIHAPGEFFGLGGLLGQAERREYARTLRSKAKMVILKNSDLFRLMEANFVFAEKIMGMAARQIKRLENRIFQLSERSATARFTDYLLGRLNKEGTFDGKAWFYDGQVTQEEIGAYIGTGRQTITEILTELKAKKILEYNWGKFWVYDVERLKTLIT